ncbi:uncharacterized protein LOC116614066 [Nematostella vectensis]|uniref:uncharacterized protein LOC116614066 n=1 Tax=Nematostella vectensis TaxID=45351 RepID=UPI00139040FC|nr:uncharacterized protein LOC116614066 [Nematostella vectensis]
MKLLILVLALLCVGIVKSAIKPPPFGCRPRDPFPYKLGCYRGYVGKQRYLLNKLLFTDRDPSSRVFSGQTINWRNWKTYVNGLACRCAKAAYNKGYTMFGLQFYGECWSGPVDIQISRSNLNFAYKAKPAKCVQNYHQKCQRGNPYFACVGGAGANYLYVALPAGRIEV